MPTSVAGEQNSPNVESKRNSESAKQVYLAKLMPLNDSGVRGQAILFLEGNELTVRVIATGLEPNMPHPQHIHGFEDKRNSVCPPESADTDGDGLISLVEGAPFYGPVLLSLYEPIDEFPVATNSGLIRFERTFTLGETEFEEEGQVISKEDLMPLINRAIVLHGMTVNGEYNPVLPVACAEITMPGNSNRR